MDLLWGRYHFPQNVFLVTHFETFTRFLSRCFTPCKSVHHSRLNLQHEKNVVQSGNQYWHAPARTRSHFFLPQTFADQLNDRMTSAWKGVLEQTSSVHYLMQHLNTEHNYFRHCDAGHISHGKLHGNHINNKLVTYGTGGRLLLTANFKVT